MSDTVESFSSERISPIEKFQKKPGEGFNPQSPEEYKQQKENEAIQKIQRQKEARKEVEQAIKKMDESFSAQFLLATAKPQGTDNKPPVITDNSNIVFTTNDPDKVTWQTRTEYKKNPGRDEGGI